MVFSKRLEGEGRDLNQKLTEFQKILLEKVSMSEKVRVKPFGLVSQRDSSVFIFETVGS